MHSADEQFLISLEEVEQLHDSALARDGGMPGLADRPGLLSALGGAFQTFGGHELYPTIQDKAAKVSFEIIMRHPFNDGNKRTAAAQLLVVPRRNGVYVLPGRDDLYKTVLDLAADDIEYADLIRTLRSCVRAQK